LTIEKAENENAEREQLDKIKMHYKFHELFEFKKFLIFLLCRAN